MRVICATTGGAGHLFPMLGLAEALRGRGADVTLLTGAEWHPQVETLGFEARPAPSGSGAWGGWEDFRRRRAEEARAVAAELDRSSPEILIADPYTLTATLAAEMRGVSLATLLPDPFHLAQPGLPVFADGLVAPRTALGRAAWRAAWPLAARAQRRVRAVQDALRAELELAPLGRADGAISGELAMVATFPQLEYPRRWPAGVHITGPILYSPPSPPVEPPAGDGPLAVVVATTAGLGSAAGFAATAIGALRRSGLRVVATTGRSAHPPAVEDEGVVAVEWLDLDRILEQASLVVCQGGHGTVARSLAAGVPVLVCPVGGNTALIGARVAWAGVGAVVPRRLAGASTIRAAAVALLRSPRARERAAAMAASASANDGAARAAGLVEAYARR